MIIIYFLFIYLFLIISIFIVLNINNLSLKSYKAIIIFLIILFSILISFRNPINFPDIAEYEIFYENISLKNITIGYSYFELGFIILSYLIKIIIGNNIKIYFFLLSLFQLLVLLYAIKNILNHNIEQNKKKLKYKVLVLFLIVYIPYYGIYYNSIVLRQSFSIAFTTLGISFLINKKLINYLVSSILAILFHRTSIIFIIIGLIIYIIKYYINKKYYNYYIYILIIILSIIIGINYNMIFIIMNREIIKNFIDERMMRYILEIMNEQYVIFSLRNILLAIKFILILIIYKDIKCLKNDADINFIFYIYFIGILINMIFSSKSYIQRILDYFYIFYYYIISIGLVYDIKKKIIIFIFSLVIIIADFNFALRYIAL